MTRESRGRQGWESRPGNTGDKRATGGRRVSVRSVLYGVAEDQYHPPTWGASHKGPPTGQDRRPTMQEGTQLQR